MEPVESESTERRQVPVEIQDATGTGFFDVVDAYLDPAAVSDLVI
jgi:hypothetical protein